MRVLPPPASERPRNVLLSAFWFVLVLNICDLQDWRNMLRLVMALALAASALVAAQPSDAEAPRLSWHAIEGLGGAAKGGPERYSG